MESQIVNVRFQPEEKLKLSILARSRGCTRSDVIRELVLPALSDMDQTTQRPATKQPVALRTTFSKTE